MANDNGDTNGIRMERAWLVWAFRGLLMFIMSIGAWFGSQVMRSQERIVERLNAADVDRAGIAASRFTASDWTAAKAMIDAQTIATDRRVFKLETAQEQVGKALERIESKLGTK